MTAGEFELIARYFAPLAEGAAGAFGLKDDAALLEVAPGRSLVVTNDSLVAGVHFRPDDPADLIARKLLRVNLSDLAAMGAEPRAYLLAAVLPQTVEEAWVERFASGLAQDQAQYDVVMLGGDTVASPGPLVVSLTALGEVEAEGVLRRAGARPGDVVFVSGSVGDAALGLKVLQGGLRGLAAEARDFLVDRYRLPRPRLALGARLAGRARACIDVSDGVVADLAHICASSGVAAVVEAARLPLAPAARAALDGDPALVADVLTGGDDYELLFAAPAAAAEEIAALSRELELPLTPIGQIREGAGVGVVDAEGNELPLAAGGYTHF